MAAGEKKTVLNSTLEWAKELLKTKTFWLRWRWRFGGIKSGGTGMKIRRMNVLDKK